jgi:hypothetical protein
VAAAPTAEELIESAAWTDYLAQLRAGNQELINQLLDGLELSDDQREAYYQYLDDMGQLAADTQKAQGLGLDVEEFQEYVEYLKSIPKYAELAQREIDEIAIANMRINRGVESLSKNYKDWMDIIEAANKKGNE